MPTAWVCNLQYQDVAEQLEIWAHICVHAITASASRGACKFPLGGSGKPMLCICNSLFELIEQNTTDQVLCLLSESPSRKREDLHDNATHKGREIYWWLEPGPLLQPMQWCKVREPRAPVSMHIYRVLEFKHKQWVVGTSGWLHVCKAILLVQTCARAGLSRGTSRRFTGRVLISWSLVACWGQIITLPWETETQAYS